MARIRHWRAFARRIGYKSEAEKISDVNGYFNAFRFAEDADLWQKPDYWATPLQLLAAGAGDCEDFAIAKYFTLRELGVPARRLRITYVWNHDTPSGRPDSHMVLLYVPSGGGGPMVLDILTDSIKSLAKRRGLEPVYSLNSEGLWLAGDKARAIAAGSPRLLPQWRQLTRAMEGDAMLMRIP